MFGYFVTFGTDLSWKCRLKSVEKENKEQEYRNTGKNMAWCGFRTQKYWLGIRRSNHFTRVWSQNTWIAVVYEQMSREMTKPTKWLCAQRRLRSAWVSAQSSSYGQRRLWSDWADAQADLSLRLEHTHFVGSNLSCPGSNCLREYAMPLM